MADRKICTFCAQEGHRAHSCPRRPKLADYFLGTLIGLVLIALSGCETAPVVKVPVTVPCKVEEPKQPAYKFTPPYENIFAATKDLLGDREVSQAYENELRAALRGCK